MKSILVLAFLMVFVASSVAAINPNLPKNEKSFEKPAPEVEFTCFKGMIVSVEISNIDMFSTNHIKFPLDHTRCKQPEKPKDTLKVGT